MLFWWRIHITVYRKRIGVVGLYRQINEEDEFVIGYINTNLRIKENLEIAAYIILIEEVDNINDYKK